MAAPPENLTVAAGARVRLCDAISRSFPPLLAVVLLLLPLLAGSLHAQGEVFTTLPTPAGGLPLGASHSASPARPRSQASSLDSDGDGLSDSVEDDLLARFRPYYRFSVDDHGEYVRPTDPIWYIERSELLWDGEQNYQFYGVIPNSTLANDPYAVLTANRAGTDWGSSDMTTQDPPKKTKYYINVLDSRCDGYRYGYCSRTGEGHDWPEILELGNVGLFGHVVPYGPFIKIEYWQFFAFNQPDVVGSIGDHEGDWCVVELLYDPRRDIIARVYHYAHGKEMHFDMNYRTDALTHLLPDGAIEYAYHYDPSCIEIDHGYITPGAQLNTVRMWPDPQSGRFEHPVVYIERGTHEFWPTQYWCFSLAPNHNGQGYSYLTSTPPNLGEVRHPGSEEARVILHYNGKWGAYSNNNGNPPGPTLHTEWTWVEGDPLEHDLAGAEDGATSWRFGPPVAVITRTTPVGCADDGYARFNLTARDSYDRDGFPDGTHFYWQLLHEPYNLVDVLDVGVRLAPGHHIVALTVWEPATAVDLGGPASIDTLVVDVAPVPAAPQGRAPGEGATCQSTTGQLTWAPVPGADGYEVLINTDASDWSSPVVDVVVFTNACHYGPAGPLASGTTFYWKVRSWRGPCNGPFSSVLSFSTVQGTLPAPTRIAPANPTPNAPPTGVLVWEEVPGAGRYRVSLSCLGGHVAIVDSTETTSYAYNVGAGRYVWSVSAVSACGEPGAVSFPPWGFDVGATACELPQMLSPPDSEVCIQNGDTLRWTRAKGIDVYRVLLTAGSCGDDGAYATARPPSPDTFFVLRDLLPDTTYTWWLMGSCGCSGATWTGCRSFRTAPGACVDAALVSQFTVDAVEGGIALRWQFGDGSGVVTSWAERADAEDGSWARVEGEVHTEGGLLTMVDGNVTSRRTYYYRLAARFIDGREMRFGSVVATAGEAIAEFALAQVSPNPTSGSTRIDFSVPQAARVRLSVLDVEGRIVALLVDGVVPAGRHEAVWSGEMTRGLARAGIYFVRYEAAGRSFVKRVVLAQ